MTTIDFVPPKLVLPPTVVTVNVTDVVRLRIPDLDTVHGVGVVEQVDVPLAPLLHVPATLVATGEPLLVTPIVTYAVHLDPELALDAVSATAGRDGADTVTLPVVLPVAPSSSVAVSATAYVPPL